MKRNSCQLYERRNCIITVALGFKIDVLIIIIVIIILHYAQKAAHKTQI